MKRSFTLLLLLCLNKLSLGAGEAFNLFIDLKQCTNNTLHVRLQTPRIPLQVVKFILPSNVPGTISEIKTGKLLSNFSVLDSLGNPLKFFRVSINEFEIISEGKIATIEYDMHDSWHYTEPNIILPQIGTSFVTDKHFVLNMHAVSGYIMGYEIQPFNLYISKPQNP